MSHLRVTIVLKTNEGGRWIIPHVEEMLRRGHFVTVILPSGQGRLESLLREYNVRVIPSAFDFEFKRFPAVLKGLIGLRKQIIESSPSVLHYHLYASALAARISTLGLGLAKVHMVAGPLYLESKQIALVERLLMWTDTILVAGSAHTARLYRGLGLSPRKVRTIPYGVDIDRFHQPSADESASARKALGLGPDAFVAVMVAYVYGPKRMVHSGSGIKGHDVLLEAWSEFSKGKSDVHLILVGEGFDAAGESHRKQLMQAYGDKTAGLRFVDRVLDVRPYYWASNVSVSPSLSENHGAALEAAACGVARIVSDAGGLPETTGPSSGWVVPKGSPAPLARALEEAYRDFRSGALASKALSSRQVVETRFNARKSAVELVDLLESSAGEGREPAAPRVTLVSEARLGTTPQGAVAAVDSASGAAAWIRYVRRIPGFTLAARTDLRLSTATASLAGVPVDPICYYKGVRSFFSLFPRVFLDLSAIVRRSDVLIVRLPGPLGFVAFALGRMMRRPVFAEVVGDPGTVLRTHTSGSLRLLARPAEVAMRFCVNRASGTRFVTTNTLQSLYPPKAGVPSFAMSNVQLSDEDYSEDLVFPSGTGWRLTAIGSQETDYKGHDTALYALKILADAGYTCRLLLVGQGLLHESLQTLASTLGIAGQVEFRQRYETKGELRDILESTDIFLHPSRSEGLPRVVIEAMARARPVVGSCVGGLPELISPPFLVEPSNPEELADRVRELIDNPLQAVVAGRTNRGRAREFHYSKLSAVFDLWCETIRLEASDNAKIDAARGGGRDRS